MSVIESLTAKVSQLPTSQQLEVLDFVEFLASKQKRKIPLHNPRGLLAEQLSDLTLEDFVAARREMWRNFPRELPE
jgi:hypothetical protein